MKKVLFFILLLWCPFSIVSAQFVNFGQDRPSLRWKQIKTDDFQIIYPDFFEEKRPKSSFYFQSFIPPCQHTAITPQKDIHHHACRRRCFQWECSPGTPEE